MEEISEYISAGANRQTAAADWHRNGILAFGADVNVALWRPEDQQCRGIIALAGGHKGQVKAVTFLPQVDDDGQLPSAYLVSGADDHTLKVWSISPDAGTVSCLQTLEDHAAAINCIAAVAVAGQNGRHRTVVASGAADASIRVWSFEAEELKLQQTIKTQPRFFPLALALGSLGDDGGVVLAAGGTRETVQIYVGALPAAGPASNFTLQAMLSGHQGWIRSLDICPEISAPGSDVILASASQDKYVRLWRFRAGQDLPVAAAGSDPTLGAFLPGKSPSNKAHRIRAGGRDFSVTFEALLLGHEDWVYSARWYRSAEGKLQLLSASADNSLAVWEADPASGIWVTSARLGALSRDKGATTATGSVGGFWTGLWSPAGSGVACLGRTGGWRRWEYDGEQDKWVQLVAVTGHTKAVTGVSWSRDGRYLLSTSSDQTTRLHTQWKRGRSGTEPGEKTETKTKTSWHEASRPQIHGYDLNRIDTLGPSMFVSGADEKLMRVFREPKSVARLVGRLAGAAKHAPLAVDADDDSALPEAADMPVLGLSNKAVDAARGPASDDMQASSVDLDHPPFEDSLSRLTLWPEVEKLYGHGYEISCLATSHDGKLVASACKATSLNHAVIRIFETDRWTEPGPPLAAHTLTATRLRFSQDDRFLLSVGRDRQWAVFERTGDAAAAYVQRDAHAKAHARMILDAAWAPWHRPRRVFATAGRDKHVKIWISSSESEGDSAKFTLAQALLPVSPEPVTALDFFPRTLKNGNALLAVGTEAGALQVISLSLSGEEVAIAAVFAVKPAFCLPKAVLQLAWRPTAGAEEWEDEEELSLAIAGEDGSLRIYRFRDPLLCQETKEVEDG